MSGVKDAKPRRTYQSPTRDEGARRTRAAIVNAAAELFVARGYVGTSLAQVAAAAGVARPTAFAAFGSKPAVLRQVVDQALAGDDEPGAVADRPWFRPVWDASTAGEVLDAYAGVCVLIGGRVAAVFEVVRRAADDAPEVAELWRTMQDNRRAGAAMVIRRVEALGPLADNLTTDTATDLLWLLNDSAHYGTLVFECGWPPDTYRSWLARTMRDAILPR